MKRLTAAALLLLLIVACKKADAPPAETAAAPPAPGTPAWKVLNARSAAPAQISMNATVVDGVITDSVPGATLAPGENGWTCWADNPATNNEDPICVDEQGLVFVRAWISRQPPRLTGMGVAYTLKGGSPTASDTDPYKAAPDSGQPWTQEPPQIGIVMPSARSYTGLPTRRRPDGPWVRFAGTPYAYIVVPSGP